MRILRNALIGLAIVAATLPVALISTFLLMPLWSAIESSTGIESVGHSGPAEWCFAAMWVAILGLTLLARRAFVRRRAAPSASAKAERGASSAH